VIELAETEKLSFAAQLHSAVSACYDIGADDARLRTMLALPAAAQPAFFDRLRKEYPVRREFSETAVLLDPALDGLAQVLRGLGFAVMQSA
jgi:erythronate-4-phosphate dehydrogenase